MASRGDPSSAPVGLRVAVASDLSLVAESVCAALDRRGLQPVQVTWPRPAPAPQVLGPRRSRAARRLAGPPPDVGLLVSDLGRVAQVQEAAALAAGLPVPWLVMAGAPRGAAWGGLYERGVRLVIADDTGLDEVHDLLGDVAEGWQPEGHRRARRELVHAWLAFAHQRDATAARLGTLTQREEEVLRCLHEGMEVRLIAERSRVAEATVRTQVKAILRKLGVGSQMAAVAAYQGLLTDSTDVHVRDGSLPPREHGGALVGAARPAAYAWAPPARSAGMI